jgi:hypothetical protein
VAEFGFAIRTRRTAILRCKLCQMAVVFGTARTHCATQNITRECQ